MIFTIAINEFKRIWHSYIAWVLFAIALFLLGLLLLIFLNNFYSETQDKLVNLRRAPGLTDLVITPYLFWTALIGVFMVPLFAVRSSTEERQQGANLLLSSAPLSTVQIVLGKYIALVLLAVVYTLVCSAYALVLGYFTAIDYGKIAALVLAVFLFIASFNAAALFLANLTRTPIVATAAIIGMQLLFVMLYFSGSATASSSGLFLYLANFSHLIQMLSGSINTTDVAYFFIFTLLFLSFTYLTLKYRKTN